MFNFRRCFTFAILVTMLGATSHADQESKYIGTEACVRCHPSQHASYLDTLHSKSFQHTSADTEPASGLLVNDTNGCQYEVTRSSDQLIHRETIKSLDHDAIASTEQPIRFTIGSGDHAKSYFVENDGFLSQSPITWYRSINGWDMSPGFKDAGPQAFSRKVNANCVFCHVGRIERETDAMHPYRFNIVETQIGCERCHGPGEAHANGHETKALVGSRNQHIVHPAKLSRDLAEAICQQCHLQGDVSVRRYGKDDWQFRPGESILETRIDYRYPGESEGIRLVGHVEQMHSSDCYTGSDSLTCTSCHEPHNRPQPEKRAEFYRDKCMSCHESPGCGTRRQEQVKLVENDCTVCHMPKLDVANQTHLALNNHRIGIYDEPKQVTVTKDRQFRTILDTSHLTADEQKRGLALVLYGASRVPSEEFPPADVLTKQATELLIAIKTDNRSDAVLDAALADLAWQSGQKQIAATLATEVLSSKTKVTSAKIEAARVLGQHSFAVGNADQAIAIYRRLDTAHRDSFDAYFLGLCEQNSGNTDAAIKALTRSLEINPAQTAAHEALAAIYHSLGRSADAERHRQLAPQIAQYFSNNLPQRSP